MKYFTVQGSCLISILIPINYLIGEYTKWFVRKNKKELKRKWDVAIVLIGIVLTAYYIYLSIDPYIPFVFMGGILVGIVENTLLWKNETNTDENGGYFWYINVLWGVGLFFYRM